MLLTLLLSLVAIVAAPSRSPLLQDAAALAQRVREAGDDVTPEQLRALADTASPEALEGLRQALDTLANRHAQLTALECLGAFVGTASEGEALSTWTQAATQSPLPELRTRALELLGGAGPAGRAQLTAIVLSEADLTVRETALELHVAAGSAEDAAWYEGLWTATARKGTPLHPAPIRELGFAGAAPALEWKALVKASEDDLPGVRRAALAELVRRDDGRAVKVAEALYGNRQEDSETRLAAARFLVEKEGAKRVPELFHDATHGMPSELALALADLVRDHLDDKFARKVVKDLDEGQPLARRVALRAVARLPDARVDVALVEAADDVALDVALEAVRIMGERGGERLVAPLEALVDDGARPDVQAAAVVARSQLEAGAEAWMERLRGLAAGDAPALRRAALEVLGRRGDAHHLDVLTRALDSADWTTRLLAVQAIEHLHVKEGVGVLCEHIADESSRRVAWEMREALWRMTGEPLGFGKQWQNWWKDQAETFQFPTSAEIVRRTAERERREASQVTRSFRGVAVDSRFFGLRLKTNSVAFVVDVSGSMQERLPGDRREKGPTRMEVAKKELRSCLEALESGTRFNVIAFSDFVESWREEAPVLDEASFGDVEEFVDGLRPLMRTKMYAALETAFRDRNIDTIFVLSDGEPTDRTPGEIREAVQRWNAGRHVVIHTIAVGPRFPLLRWLAEDSGGEYRTYP